MKFLENLKAVVALLGLGPQFAEGNLSPEEQASLIKAYEDSTKGSFKDDLEAWQKEQKEAADNQAMAEAFKELASALNVPTPEGADVASIVSSIKASIEEMKTTINNLGAQSQGDQPAATVTTEIRISGPHTATHAFGVQHEMFAANKRWNKIAMTRTIPSVATTKDEAAFNEAFAEYAQSLANRYAMLASTGMLEAVKAGTMDYDLIKDEEIGTRYFVRRQDALIARIASYPSLAGIFPARSNIQDGDVLTNVLFEELSQAYQEGKLSKGHIKFVPEKAQVHDVMFKYLFKSMKWIETSIVAEQYIDAISVMKLYSSGHEDSALDILVKVLYCPLPYSKDNMQKVMLHQFSREQKVAAYYNFRGLLEWIRKIDKYDLIFNSAEPRSGRSPIGLEGSLYSLSKAGYGIYKDICSLDLFTYLDMLLSQTIESIHSLKGCGLKLTEIAEKLNLTIGQISSVAEL